MTKLISKDAYVAIKSFLSTFIIFFLISFSCVYYSISSGISNLLVFGITLLTWLIFTKVIYNDPYGFQIAIRATLLGAIFTIGLYIRIMAAPHIQIFGAYMCVMAFFHFSEFVTMAIIQPSQVTTASFVINHSPQYIVAALSSWLEFFMESYMFPGMKQVYWLSNMGVVICIMGEVLRKTAMLTAGSNFHHLVQCEKAKNHVLVTHGVYAWFRHPSYVGWFYWSMGTQIILVNPLCFPAYIIASWMFFKSRIYIEEITLLNFFGQNYCDYQEKVGTGIPYIKGYKI